MSSSADIEEGGGGVREGQEEGLKREGGLRRWVSVVAGSRSTSRIMSMCCGGSGGGSGGCGGGSGGGGGGRSGSGSRQGNSPELLGFKRKERLREKRDGFTVV